MRHQHDVHLSYDYFKIAPPIINQLALDLYTTDKIEGIFYYNGTYFEFYPVKHIRNYMIDHQFHFTFEEITPFKELSRLDPHLPAEKVKELIEDKEIELLTTILKDLMKKEKVKGTFDDKKLSFSSFDWTFARTYEKVINRCTTLITPLFPTFEQTHSTIKEVLTDKEKVLSPKAIDIIEGEIKKIQSNFETWRSDIYGIIGNANLDLFDREKIEKLENAPKNLKRIQDDPLLAELLEKFESWTRLINEIEVKYGSIIYYHKWLVKNPESKETSHKLNSLYKELLF